LKHKKKKFNLPFYGLVLALRLKNDTYQFRRLICNPWDQCYNNKILYFWWNPHCRIKLNPKPNPLSSPSLFHLSPFCYFLIKLLCLFMNDGKSFWIFDLGYRRCWSVSWKKSIKCKSLFISTLQFTFSKLVVTKADLPILTSNHNFST